MQAIGLVWMSVVVGVALGIAIWVRWFYRGGLTVYGKILVALENRRTDEAILSHIEPLARLMGSRLLLVHVADGWVARHLEQLNLAESAEMREDRAYLESVRARFAERGLEAETLLLRGEPADEIVRLAEEARRRPHRHEHSRPPLPGRSDPRLDGAQGAARGRGPDPAGPRAAGLIRFVGCARRQSTGLRWR